MRLARTSPPRPSRTRSGRVRPPPYALCWATAGLLAGQAFAARIPRPAAIAAALVLGCALFLLGPVPRLPLLVGLAAAVGCLQLDALHHPALESCHVARLAGTTVRARALVAARPAARSSGTRLLLELSDVWKGDAWVQARGRALVTVRHLEHAWRRGDLLEGSFRLRRPRNFGNPGEFDYEAYLARRGVYATGFAISDREWLRRTAPPSPARALEEWRAGVARLIDERLEPPARLLVATLLIGEGGALPREMRETYARAGVSHILSISGLHVGLVATIAFAACRWLLSRSEWLLLRGNVPKLSLGLAMPAVLAYAAIAGGSLPTLRAAVMILLLLVGTVVDRQRHWPTVLAASAFAISLSWPGSIHEASFQLSFAAVASIVIGMPRVEAAWRRREERHLLHLRGPVWKAVRWIVLYEAATLCAIAGTAPLAAWHFNRVSLIAPLANTVVVPLVGFAPVGLGLPAVFLAPVAPQAASVLLEAAGLFAGLGNDFVALCAAAPFASLRVVTPSAFELGLIYATLAGLLVRRRAARRVVLAACLVVWVADAGWWTVERFHRRELRVSFLSVGQGDGAVIEFPGSEVMVLDGGGLSPSFDVGERIVAPYLWRRKIGRLDYVVLSHPQFDHYGGLGFLVRAFDPTWFWWNGALGNGMRFDEFWGSVTGGPAFRIGVRLGFRRVIGGVEVLALWPDPPAPAGVNDRSLTLRMRYGPTTLLFPGDLEREGERRLLSRSPEALAATILKVPHHGSRTSSTAAFLDAVAPRHAVVSAGYDNRFRMPHEEVVEAYRSRGVRLWRTDRDGAVIFRVARDGRIGVTTGTARGSALDRLGKASLKRGDNSATEARKWAPCRER